MTTISGAFGVSNVFSLPIDHSSKDSTSESSRRSRRESEHALFEEAVSGHEFDETYNDPLMQDEGVLESYTKIWESFETKDFINQKVSKSPILSYSIPFYPSRIPVQLSSEIAPSQMSFKFNLQLTNQIYSNSKPSDDKTQYLSDLASWIQKSFQENLDNPVTKVSTPPLSPWWSLSAAQDFNTQAPRAKANSFGYQLSPQNTSQNGVGARVKENFKEFTFSSKSSSKNSSPSKLFQTYLKTLNPEEDSGEKWEEDTNDTEIMKNINSLLDSDLYDYKETVQTQIVYNPEIYVQQHAQ